MQAGTASAISDHGSAGRWLGKLSCLWLLWSLSRTSPRCNRAGGLHFAPVWPASCPPEPSPAGRWLPGGPCPRCWVAGAGEDPCVETTKAYAVRGRGTWVQTQAGPKSGASSESRPTLAGAEEGSPSGRGRM